MDIYVSYMKMTICIQQKHTTTMLLLTQADSCICFVHYHVDYNRIAVHLCTADLVSESVCVCVWCIRTV